MDSELDVRAPDHKARDLRHVAGRARTGPAGERIAPENRTTPSAEPRREPGEGDERPGGNDADSPPSRAPAGPRRGRKLLLGALGAVALAAGAAGGYVYYRDCLLPFESTDDAFVDARAFSIAPKVPGYVVAVPVTDNQHVAAGDSLFEIDKRDYQTALEQAEAQITAADASVRNYEAQMVAQQAQIEGARAAIGQAEAALQFAQQDAARYAQLATKGFGTVQNQQSTTSALQQREAALSQARSNLANAEGQMKTLDAQRNSATAQLAVAGAQRDQARLNLAYTHLEAVQPGRVARLTGARGQYAQAGQSLAMFVPDRIWITANFKETQITDMRPGQPVEVEIDAYPDHEVTGRVDSVQPGSGTAFSLLPAENATGNYVKVTQRVPVKIVVDNWPRDVTIGPGMSIVPKVRVR